MMDRQNDGPIPSHPELRAATSSMSGKRFRREVSRDTEDGEKLLRMMRWILREHRLLKRVCAAPRQCRGEILEIRTSPGDELRRTAGLAVPRVERRHPACDEVLELIQPF